MEDEDFRDKPLYRVFNVILFLLYFAVVIIALLAGLIGYGERSVIQATVVCKDGTTWDALEPKYILYDSYAKCGLCTKRSQDNKSYLDCNYKDMDYSSFDTKEVKETWTWSTIIYPLVVIVVGFGIVDFLKLAIVYIFSGRVALESSLLLRVLVAMFANEG